MNKNNIALIVLTATCIFLCAVPLCAQEYGASATELFNYGKQLFKENNFADAKHEFEKCLLINPQHRGARAYIELCRELLGTQEQAAEPLIEPVTEPSPMRDDAMLIALEDARQKTDVPASPPAENELTQETEEPASAQEDELTPAVGKGAWTLKKGQFYTELYTKYYWHKNRFDAKNHKRDWDYGGKGDELRTELKLEYGLSDLLTLLLYTVAKEAHWSDDFKNTSAHGFSEIWPGVKINLFTQPFIATLQSRLKFPLSYSEEVVPALGNRQIDWEIKLLTAQPWPKLRSYTKVEFGFLARNTEPANQIPYFFEYGYNPCRWLTLKTTLDCVEGLADTGSDEDYLKYTLGPILRVWDLLNLELGFGHTFYGKNTSAAKEIFCTLSRQW